MVNIYIILDLHYHTSVYKSFICQYRNAQRTERLVIVTLKKMALPKSWTKVAFLSNLGMGRGRGAAMARRYLYL